MICEKPLFAIQLPHPVYKKNIKKPRLQQKFIIAIRGFGSYREFPRHELATLENNARACHIFKFLGQKCPNRRETMALFRLQQFASNLLKWNVASVPCASNC